MPTPPPLLLLPPPPLPLPPVPGGGRELLTPVPALHALMPANTANKETMEVSARPVRIFRYVAQLIHLGNAYQCECTNNLALESVSHFRL
jgi:hypothetical protein